jgi:hypothetical protein
MKIQLTQNDVPVLQWKRIATNALRAILKEPRVSARRLDISSTIKDPRKEQIELVREDFVPPKSCSNVKVKHLVLFP